MGHRVEPLSPLHLERMLEIEQASFHRPWRREHFLQEFSSGRSVLLGVWEGETVAGFLILSILLDEGEILDLAVDPRFRGRGYGRLLVEHAIRVCVQKGVTALHLEVRANAVAALSLYRSLGFRESGLRKGYYEEGIDAILMTRHFEPSDEVP